MPSYDPNNWYWISQDNRLFSSATASLIQPTDAAYKAWTATGGIATPWPKDDAGVQSTAALQDVLRQYGVFADIKSYAAAVRWTKVNGGVTYKGRPITTDDASRNNIMAETLAAQVMGASFSSAWKCADGTWMALPDAAAMIAFGTAVRNYVAWCYATEETVATTATSRADVDNAAWPISALI